MRINVKTDRSLFEALVSIVGLLQCREIMSAWAGLKVARIGIKTSDLKRTLKVLDELKLNYHIIPELVYLKRDIGKGGWSNKFDESKNIPSHKGDQIIYVGKTKKELKNAFKADLFGDEGEFGINLGIPQCCVDFYLRNQEKAYQKQNDFVPLVLNNTKELHSFNYWNNYVSQYFGYSLLSFFPCSFNCDKAAIMAQNTYELMSTILPDQAEKIIHFQKQPILYSEYRGIYMFEGCKTIENKIFITNCILHSTLTPKSKTHLFVSDLRIIEVLGKNKLKFTSFSNQESFINSSNWAMCTFA
jgi:hypothetical protein